MALEQTVSTRLSGGGTAPNTRQKGPSQTDLLAAVKTLFQIPGPANRPLLVPSQMDQQTAQQVLDAFDPQSRRQATNEAANQQIEGRLGVTRKEIGVPAAATPHEFLSAAVQHKWNQMSASEKRRANALDGDTDRMTQGDINRAVLGVKSFNRFTRQVTDPINRQFDQQRTDLINTFEKSEDTLKRVANAVLQGDTSGLQGEELIMAAGPPEGLQSGTFTKDVLQQQVQQLEAQQRPQTAGSRIPTEEAQPTGQFPGGGAVAPQEPTLGGANQPGGTAPQAGQGGPPSRDTTSTTTTVPGVPTGPGSPQVGPEVDDALGDDEDEDGGEGPGGAISPEQLTQLALASLLGGGQEPTEEELALIRARTAQTETETSLLPLQQALEEDRLEQQRQIANAELTLRREIESNDNQLQLFDTQVRESIARGRLREAALARKQQGELALRQQALEREGQTLNFLGSILSQPLALPGFQATGGIEALGQAFGLGQPQPALPGQQSGDTMPQVGAPELPGFTGLQVRQQQLAEGRQALVDAGIMTAPEARNLTDDQVGFMLRHHDLPGGQADAQGQQRSQASASQDFQEGPFALGRFGASPGTELAGSPGGFQSATLASQEPRQQTAGRLSAPGGASPQQVAQPVQPLSGGGSQMSFLQDLFRRTTPLAKLSRRDPRTRRQTLGRL